MASSGSGTGTPITGSGSATLTPRTLPHTLLSLERYAQIMGLDPVHFNQGHSEDYFPVTNTCPDVWYKYAWQKHDVVSRENLAYQIEHAEQQIAHVLGYWPAPTWTSSENIHYEQFHRPDMYTVHGRGPTGLRKTIKAYRAKIRAVGRRSVALAGDSVAVTYSDEDGDGFAETATVSVDITGSAAKTVLDNGWPIEYANTQNLRVYHEDHSGNPGWEVRSPISHSYSGTTVTILFNSWQLVRPDLLEEHPNLDGSPNPIDVSDTNNLVSAVDVYLEYTDLGSVGAQMVWEEDYDCDYCSGSGCTACAPQTVNGCATIRDPDLGIVVPKPASYDASSDSWSISSTDFVREPNWVKLWYLSGHVSEQYQQGYTNDPLSHHFAQAIAWLATARLQENICACGNAMAIAQDLRKDLAVVSPEGNFVIGIDEVLENPFGTRKGEVMAWRAIRRLSEKVLTGHAI